MKMLVYTAVLVLALASGSGWANEAGKTSTPENSTRRIGITGPVVGQYFGIFNVSKVTFRKTVDSAPFDKTNLLLIAFVHTYPEKSDGSKYVVGYEEARAVPSSPADADTDADRIDYLVSTARAKNPSIKILVSLGWGKNRDVEYAVKSPTEFAASVKSLVARHKLDGFDIDYEFAPIYRPINIDPKSVLVLAQALRAALPDKVLTITPAEQMGLNAAVLRTFDLVMPQTYAHGGNGTSAVWYLEQLGDWSKIVLGLNSEGQKGMPTNGPDDPSGFAKSAKDNKAAGIFAWRLDSDSQVNSFPTFETANAMWKLMH